MDSSGEEIELTPIGDLSGNCKGLRLNGAIDSIQASNDGTAVTAIKYFKGTSSVSYGTLDADF